MLDNLRAMAVFASVVHHGSFSGAGKELNITTSAVSQQIRALEMDLGVVLLHRSTRKLSLTEAGASLYESAKNIVHFAEEAKDNVGQLRDGLLGNLRIATTPKIAREYIMPALSVWLNKHNDLSLMIFTASQKIDMIDERVDLSVYFTETGSDGDIGVPLAKVNQFLVASPKYLAHKGTPQTLDELEQHSFIGETNHSNLSFLNKREVVKISSRFATNDDALALSLAKSGQGILKTNELDAKDALHAGELVPILGNFELPKLILHAKTLSKEQQPAKVWRCLEVLTDYFAKL